MVRSMLLKNSQVRAVDRFFENAFDQGFHSPFAVMDKILDGLSTPVPPADGSEFTVYKMVPTKYKVEHQQDGSVHYNIVEEAAELEEQG